ncbi:MAG: tyrosine-type recombinase/integrase, partial [Chlorobium sp.]|nr:tyrosine-type recombinase/integrase [Chlorobium sp.]
MAIKFIRNSETPGMAIWQVDWWPDGRNGSRRKKRIDCTHEEAVEFEKAVKRGAGIGREVVTVTRLTLTEALPEYMRWHQQNRMPNTHSDTKISMVRLMALFGNMVVSQIRPFHIVEYVAQRPQYRRSNQKDIHYLQGFISWMVKTGYADPLPFKPETPKYTPPLPTAPAPTDVLAMLEQIKSNTTRALIYLMWNTGARISSAREIKWENINWERGSIIVMMKGGRPLILSLPDEVKEILWPIKQERGFVFENPKTGKPIFSIKTALVTASRRAGLSYTITHHMLRHAYATDTLEA